MGVQVEQAGEQSLSRSVDYAGSGRHCGTGCYGFNLRATDHHGRHARRRAGSVYDARAAND